MVKNHEIMMKKFLSFQLQVEKLSQAMEIDWPRPGSDSISPLRLATIENNQS